MTGINLDVEYKLLLKKYLWHMGYFCPIEIKLSTYVFKYGFPRRYDITDIDVMGIRFDSDLLENSVIGECKTGKEETVDRVFSLKGVMDFFSASRGYLVQKFVTSHAKHVGTKLNISLLSEANLKLREKELKLDSIDFYLFNVDTYRKMNSLWGLNLPRGQKPNKNQLIMKSIYDYFGYNFWIVEDYRNIFSIIDKVSITKEYYTEYSKEKIKFLLYYATIMLTLSLLRMGGFVISRDRENFVPQIREYLFGGILLLKDRETLLKEVSKLIKKKVPLEPPYYNELLELSNRLVKFSHYSKDIPRYLEIVLSEYVLNRSSKKLEQIFGNGYSLDTLKLAKDIAIFLCDSAGVDAKIFFGKLLEI